ncbi:hypothetical protein HL657_03025 [Methanoculleus sp. YWC-01]|uniref:Uncharacterized protein n=1 Tax=Methanoculleus nereidis TaxID=2735141 RepID=A0ABU3Z026_9EURY|nr:hypothetical protein [Methanoculleus sp. YWC-01]
MHSQIADPASRGNDFPDREAFIDRRGHPGIRAPRDPCFASPSRLPGRQELAGRIGVAGAWS